MKISLFLVAWWQNVHFCLIKCPHEKNKTSSLLYQVFRRQSEESTRLLIVCIYGCFLKLNELSLRGFLSIFQDLSRNIFTMRNKIAFPVILFPNNKIVSSLQISSCSSVISRTKEICWSAILNFNFPKEKEIFHFRQWRSQQLTIMQCFGELLKT